MGMYYSDLFAIPFLLNGRYTEGKPCPGLDCYGLVIEMCRRNGKTLTDLNAVHADSSKVSEYAARMNIKEITEGEAQAGDLVQCTWGGEIHVAYMLDKRSVIHCTFDGVRVNSLLSLRNKKYFRVV